MTTTNANNPSKLQQPPTSASKATADTQADGLATIWFRQGDGTNFTVTPVYLHPVDAAQALKKSPGEYSSDGVTFATWTSGNTTAQKVGGRGRLLGVPGVAD